MNKQVKPGGRPLTRPYGEFVPHRRRVRGRWGRSVGGALGSEEKTHRKKMGETGETLAIFSLGQRGGITLCEAWWEELALGFWT